MKYEWVILSPEVWKANKKNGVSQAQGTYIPICETKKMKINRNHLIIIVQDFQFSVDKPIDNAQLTKMPARFLCFYNLTN